MNSEYEQLEKTKTEIFPNAQSGSRAVAEEIAALIREREQNGQSAVLGLATGSSPLRLYRELIRMHREEGLSFKNVVTFNLDEYFPISPDHKESYFRFMHEQLFNHIDLPPENINIPSGTTERGDVYSFCQRYEEKIREHGGIDIQILGIGRSGHIGFNEPGSSRKTRTRLITLDRVTRQDAAKDFLGEANVPRNAITMGVATIMDARRLILMAWGDGKAEIVREAVEGPVTSEVSASFLQQHPNATIIVDEAASGELTRVKRPWLVGSCEWTENLTRRAVIWLSAHLEKPLTTLVEDDYNDNGMGDLVAEQGPASEINVRIFNDLQKTLTAQPGEHSAAQAAGSEPSKPKRIVVFSPEPHDDVYYMGGTLRRLVQQGHEVHIVCQTSGALTVPHEEAGKFAGILIDSGEATGALGEAEKKLATRILGALENDKADPAELAEIRKMKGLIRRTEARAALRVCGVSPENIHFLDLPFYEKGRNRNFSLDTEDIDRTAEFLDRIKPQRIFAAGDLSDPSSSAALAFEAMETGLARHKSSDWFQNCAFWLFRASRREWDLNQVDMAVPLDPDELATKTKAIYKHQTQQSPVPSSDKETWELAALRNRRTAELFDDLGLPEYAAIEAFRRWRPLSS